MTTNAAYQAVIRELEQVLPPRVVSRSLKEGLGQLGKTPEDVTVADLEPLLRGPVLRQLGAVLPPGRADETVKAILDRMLDPDSDALRQTPASRQQARDDLDSLKESLRPFNLYFEWPEVQKLRAQLQLVEDELEAEGDAAAVIMEAREQLALLRQKLADQLVLQAGELAQLDATFERISSLGGPRVRRLETLLGRIREAQEQQVLMPAEVEQARLLSVDLHKLLESSVYSPAQTEDDPDPGATTELLPAEVNERLMRLDLDNEAHRLDQLVLQHTNLLALRPELAERLAGLRRRIVDGDSVKLEIDALEIALDEEFQVERTALQHELDRIAADEAALTTPVGAGQLRQALQVAGGILATTLPDPADIQHIRNLHELAREQLDVMMRTMHDGVGIADARRLAALELDDRQAQLNELFQIEQELSRLPEGATPELEQLAADVANAKSGLETEERAIALDGLWNRLEDVRADLARRLDDLPARLRAALSTLARVERLNSEDVATVRRILQQLTVHGASIPRLSLRLRLKLADELERAEQLLDKLNGEYEATRNIADQLVNANILDDLLGGGGLQTTAADVPAAVEPDENVRLDSGNKQLDSLLAELAGERGVEQLLLLRDDEPLSGTFRSSTPQLHQALQALEKDMLDLGESLQAGRLNMLTLELPGRIMAVAWPAARHRLLVIVDVPATLSLVLHRIRRQLTGLRGLLDDSALAR